MQLPAELVREMFRCGVVQVNTDTGFLLAAGGRSPLYLDHRRLFGVPGLREAALDVWAGALRGFMVSLLEGAGAVWSARDWCLAGTATAGIAPAFGLATRLGCSFAYVRSGAKGHGLARTVEGAEIKGLRVIMVDDMVTTGASLLQAADNVRLEGKETGVSVLGATSFTSRLARTGLGSPVALPFFSVVTVSGLLEEARRLELVPAGQWPVLKSWLAELR